MAEDSVTNLIAKALAVPGIKVNRMTFLSEQFKNRTSDELSDIIEKGPVRAGCTEKEIRKIAVALVNKRTLESTGMSFVSGIPGGPIGLSAGLTADTVQFFGIALRLAQEVSYLYGEEDLWADGKITEEEVNNQMLVYIGTMFGVSGASAAVRVVSSAFAKTALKRIPQMALTKTIYYPIVKSIAKMLSVRMTKGIFAKGVSKTIPILGGVVSGTITFASMKPMGYRLVDVMQEAHFSYTAKEFKADIETLNSIGEQKIVIDADYEEVPAKDEKRMSISEELLKYKKLLDEGIISKEEFEDIKEKLIARI